MLFVFLSFFNALSTNCGAKLQLFVELTKYFLYFCRKYLSASPFSAGFDLWTNLSLEQKYMIMTNNKLRQSLHALSSMGMAFIVLGVLMLAVSFVMNIKSNILLFAGLFFIIAGIAGYIYPLKKG